MNIIFDNFLPNGPLPNLLDSTKSIDYYKNQKDTISSKKKKNQHFTKQVGMMINPFIVDLFTNKKANLIPSYLCDTLDTWIYPVDFLNPHYFGITFLISCEPYNLDSFIPEKVFYGIVNGKGFLVLFFDGEIVRQEAIDTFLSNTRIPRNKIIIISKCILNYDNFMYTTFNEVAALNESVYNRYYTPDTSEKTKKYTCPNYFFNMPYRKYRALVSALLLHYNLVDDAVISIGKEKDLYKYLEDNNKYFHADITNKLLENKKDLSNIPEFIQPDEIGKAFFNIVLDSYFEPESKEDNLYFSEKIYIPMYYKQFYILFGRPYTLKYIKSVGYKTFDSIIDESYDEEVDDEKRFLMVFKEVKRICAMNIDQVKNLSQKVNSILEYNYNHIQTRIDQLPIDLEEKINDANI